jgi:hypothetical protein
MQREKIVEAMARSMALANNDYEGPELQWYGYVDDAQAALTALEALGLAVVPREPTEAMRRAGDDACEYYPGEDVLHIYRAMLAAAPLPAAPNQGEG